MMNSRYAELTADQLNINVGDVYFRTTAMANKFAEQLHDYRTYIVVSEPDSKQDDAEIWVLADTGEIFEVFVQMLVSMYVRV